MKKTTAFCVWNLWLGKVTTGLGDSATDLPAKITCVMSVCVCMCACMCMCVYACVSLHVWSWMATPDSERNAGFTPVYQPLLALSA